MSFVELQLRINPEILDGISAYLFAMGCEGINVTDDGVIIYFQARKWTAETKSALKDYISQFIPDFSSKELKVKQIADQDWSKGWRKYFKFIKLTDRVTVQPPWDEYKAVSDQINLIINPKMAFGTGHHESTQLMVELAEKYIRPGNSVLDLGTGSGILAILAKKLGAEMVIGIDNDPVTVPNAEENAALNNVTGIQFYIGTLAQLERTPFDVVMANINRNILLEHARLFEHYIKPGGILLLSGLLRSDEAMMVSTMKQNGYTLLKKIIKREWLGLAFKISEEKG